MRNEIDEYRTIVGTNEIEEIKMLAGRLEGTRMHNVNSTAVGGGVAEILMRLIPLMRGLGIDATWETMSGADDFYAVTKAFHNGLHGKDVEIVDKMFEIFENYTQLNIDTFEKEADCYIIHDPQPVGLIRKKKENPGSKWVWRCHIDVSRPLPEIWDFLEKYVRDYDASIFSMPEFSQKLSIPQVLISPSIDPLSDKNRELDRKFIEQVFEKYGIDPDRPSITQVSRFDRLKDPVGVIEAYKLAKKRTDCQLVLAGGGATDDPEGKAVLDEVMAAADGDPDIKILELPPFSDLDINALQRGSSIVVQKSLREGFGLTVTEALWKATPVIGSAVGGIKSQIINGVTGYLVWSIEGCARRFEDILRDPEKSAVMARNGKELVRSRFLLTRHIKNYLMLMVKLTGKAPVDSKDSRIMKLVSDRDCA
ncbi:MAG TPA: glycosyltransferase [bacterium]|nr:glycosyltransferase [bacterium]